MKRRGVASGGGELIVSDGCFVEEVCSVEDGGSGKGFSQVVGVVGEEEGFCFVVGGGFEDGCCVEGEGGCCVEGREEGFVQMMSGFVWEGGVEGDGGVEE